MSYFFIRANDRAPFIQNQVSDVYGNINLTNATGIFYWKHALNPTGSGFWSGVGTIVGTSSTGLLKYIFATGDVTNPGYYAGFWRVIQSGGATETYPQIGFIPFEIVSSIG